MIFTVLLLGLYSIQGHTDFDFEPNYLEQHYTKREVRIPMRDGVHLFTAVYSPKDKAQTYPILIWRTPYSCTPYGESFVTRRRDTWHHLARDGFIIVFQDVRGRFMSEGDYVNMRPFVPDKHSEQQVDETTDTHDTVVWLLENIPNHNGRVGLWGISYPGFYASMAAIDAHPAIKAVSPQAPIADWFGGDDWFHHGAMALAGCVPFIWSFGQPRQGLVETWPDAFDHGTEDGYQFFLDLGPLSQVNAQHFRGAIPFWNALMNHRNRDAFWTARDIRPHLKNIRPAVMVVGGWFDAENLSGALNTYQAIEKNCPNNRCSLVMGPWFHGGWVRSDGSSLGDISFDSPTGPYYIEKMELPFFQHYLKEEPLQERISEVTAFQTGSNQWRSYAQWPPKAATRESLYLRPHSQLSPDPVKIETPPSEFISDPSKPVPFTADITTGVPKHYMLEDQRFAARRPDVMVFKTDPLQRDLTMAGPIQVDLCVATSGTDSDWVVKVIDVFPKSAPTSQGVVFSEYQMLVRGDILRGKFRNSLEKPEPISPNEATWIRFSLPDVHHCFRKDHRVMVQIQCSWFPLFNLNPQTYINHAEAEPADFVKARQKIYHDAAHPSRITFGRL